MFSELTDCIHIIHVATFFSKNVIFSLHSQILSPYLQSQTAVGCSYYVERG